MKRTVSRDRLPPEETRAALESFNWSAGLRCFYDTVCGSSTFVFVAFALSLGLAKENMGILSSVAGFACVLQMLGLALLNYVEDKKAYFLSLALAEPLVLVATILAMSLLPQSARVWALGAAVFLAAASLHLTRPLGDSWVATTIPEGVRGVYLGRRFQAISAFTIVSTLIAGFAAERIDKANTFGFGWILAIGGIFGILSVAALRNVSMPALAASSRVSWADVKDALRHKPFLGYLLGSFLFGLAFFVAVPYYQVFNLEILCMKPTLIAAMTAGYFLLKIVVTPFCGRYVAQHGARATVLYCTPIYVLFFISFMFCTPERVWPLVVAWAVVSIGDAACQVAMTVALYDVAPETPSRPAYFAIASVISMGSYGLGALAAVPILQALKDVSIHVGPLALGQFHCFYVAAGVVMAAAGVAGAQFFDEA